MEPIAHPPPGWRAYEEIYRACYPAVHAYVSRRVSRSEVDDVVAEVFTTAWRRFDDLPSVPLPWLYRVAANHLAHQYRSDGRRRARVGEPPAADAIDALVGRLDDGTLVRTALARLSGADAEVLRLWAWEQLEPAQIAVVLDCSATAARVRLHRAKKRLRAVLPDPDPDPDPAPRASLITDSRY